jgi:hypothetical protein
MAKKKKKLKAAAVLTIKDAANFSADGKRRIVAWLKQQIGFISKHNRELAPTFRARYLYE